MTRDTSTDAAEKPKTGHRQYQIRFRPGDLAIIERGRNALSGPVSRPTLADIVRAGLECLEQHVIRPAEEKRRL